MLKFRLAPSFLCLSLMFPLAAMAETLPAEQAAEMLARAQSVDLKCNYLKAADKDAIASLVARAELALANKEDVEKTKATMQRGHDAGLATTCASSEKSTLMTILNAAKQASTAETMKPVVIPEKSAAPKQMASVPVAPSPAPVAQDAEKPAMQDAQIVAPVAAPEPILAAAVPIVAAEPQIAAAPEPKAQAPAMEPKKLPRVKLAAAPVEPKATPTVAVAESTPKPVEAMAKPAKAPKPSAGLGTYAKLTQSYFLALRCNSQNPSTLGSAYKAIVVEHDKVMGSHGASEVSAVLHQAQSSANSQSCSG